MMPPKENRAPKNPLRKGYYGKMIDNGQDCKNRLMVGVPMTGLLRSEWVLARYGQVIPCNWSQSDCIMWLDQYSPLRFAVADARNLIVAEAVRSNFEWLFFIDHDTILPPTTLLKINEYILKGEPPIFGGLYFTKSVPSEPLIYRGRGNSYYKDWKFGDKVWVDGLGMGCTVIHHSILKALWDESEEYTLRGVRVRRVFDTPSKMWFDPETNGWQTAVGTEDLEFLSRIIDQDILTKAGWPKYAKKKYPFLMDTNIFCTHIDWSGTQFPARGEQMAFMRKEDKAKFGIK